MNTRTVISEADAHKLAQHLCGLSLPVTVTWREGEIRTGSQNNTLHKWYGEIARHFGDRTAINVKGQCHVEWGLTIRLRDPQFAWVWKNSGAHLTFEQKCRLFEKQNPIFAMSSAMTTKELSEYMDAIYEEYTRQGVKLTVPDNE